MMAGFISTCAFPTATFQNPNKSILENKEVKVFRWVCVRVPANWMGSDRGLRGEVSGGEGIDD